MSEIIMPGAAIRRAVSLFRCTRLEFLLYVVLMVDFQYVALAGKLLETTTTTTGQATGPTKEPRVTTKDQTAKETDVFGVKLELNVSSGWAPKICHHCRRGFFRPEVTGGRQSQCNRCQPCALCAYDERLTAPCTHIQDTKCTPLCGDGFYLDRGTRTCQRNVIIKHQLLFEESTDSTAIETNSEINVLTNRFTNQPSGTLQTFQRANHGRDSSSRVVDADESDEQSPAYMTTLFASGAAGIAILVLLVIVSVYVVLRIKHWWNYKKALHDRGPCHCTCILLPCCAHCQPGNSASFEANYSTRGNRHQPRRTPIGIKVTRVKAPAESRPIPRIDSKECQEDIVDEVQNNRIAGTELSQINKRELGIENTARTSCEAAETPTFAGVETLM